MAAVKSGQLQFPAPARALLLLVGLANFQAHVAGADRNGV
jgi:hypothetical protein